MRKIFGALICLSVTSVFAGNLSQKYNLKYMEPDSVFYNISKVKHPSMRPPLSNLYTMLNDHTTAESVRMNKLAKAVHNYSNWSAVVKLVSLTQSK